MTATVERQTHDFPDACKAIGFGETTGRSLMRRCIMPTIRVGRRVLVPRWWVDDVIAGRRDLATPYTPEDANNR